MSYFKFKQFTIEQNTASMKVGTDGVLLGAWISRAGEINQILDIGTGTGLIALMLAQKFPTAEIDAIDIEGGAIVQAKKNAEQTLWKNRIHVEQIALENFIHVNKKKYDIIACNPPYFHKGWKIENQERKMARDAAHLPLEQLISAAKICLTDTGSLNLILPLEEGTQCLVQMEGSGLFCKRKTTVFTKEGQAAKRYLMEIVKYPDETRFTDLIIESEGLNNFTEEYKKLTSDFYLQF